MNVDFRQHQVTYVVRTIDALAKNNLYAIVQ